MKIILGKAVNFLLDIHIDFGGHFIFRLAEDLVKLISYEEKIIT